MITTTTPEIDLNANAASRRDRATRPWTFLFYLCGDHGQWSRRIRKNLQDMEAIEPSDQMYIVVQHDLAGEGATRFVADPGAGEIKKEVLGQVNTGDPQTALSFFRWGIQQCPSKHIAIVLGGTGIAEPHSIIGSVDRVGDYEQLFAFCDDGTAEDAMNPVELGDAFAALVEERDGHPIDLVAFDICSMQFLEIAYQLRSQVRVMVGSQNNERAPEWSYSRLINGCSKLLEWDPVGQDVETQNVDDPNDLFSFFKAMGYANPNDPRALGSVIVKVISETRHKKRCLRPIVSALDLTHLDRMTRSLDTFSLAMLGSLGNPVVWEMRDRVFKQLVNEFHERNAKFAELSDRELIAYDLLELLLTVRDHLKRIIDKGELDFWYHQQLAHIQAPQVAVLWQESEEDRRDFLRAQSEFPPFDTWIRSFPGDLASQLQHAFAWLTETQRNLRPGKNGKDTSTLDLAAQERLKILEGMWQDFQSRDQHEWKDNFENARHLLKVTKEVARLLEPASTQHATSGRSFVLASEPRRTKGGEALRSGVLIHRPQHLDRLVNSSYLHLDFHQHVHWVSLLGAINLIANHPGDMWRLISSLLSTASANARDDLLKRLTGPDSVISGVGSQFRAMRRPPCVTLSINEQTIEEVNDTVQADHDSAHNTVKRHGYRVLLESSRLGATLAEQFNRVNQQTIQNILSRLEGLLQLSWITKQHLREFESLGRSLGEDVIQQLDSPLADEWQHVLSENPNDVLHLQLQLPLDLMRYPWELMHDGEAFLGERYALGRQLSTPSGMARPVPTRTQRGLRVLIIGDPLLDGSVNCQQLFAAREEAKQVADQFERLHIELGNELDFHRERDVYIQETVTTHQFREMLRCGKYDIIHFAGHAQYVESDRERSAWIFSDGPLWAVEIRNTLAKCSAVPWLVFANACESGMGKGTMAGYQSNVFGLATAFINQGVTAYVGPLWPIGDAVAFQMAKDFYQALLLQRESVGESLRFAKSRAKLMTTRELDPSAFLGTHTGLSWASLILYGDPTMKLMDTFGMQSMGQPNRTAASERGQRQRQRDRSLTIRRQRYSATGTRQPPLQSSVSTTHDLLRGPGMEPKVLNSQQMIAGIAENKYALELDEQNGVRYWQFSDGTGYRPLPGSFLKQGLDENDSFREEFGLPPRLFSAPLTPRPIGHWLMDRNAGTLLNLSREYDQQRVTSEQLVQVQSTGKTTALGNSALRWVNTASGGKPNRILLLLHDTLSDADSVVESLGESFIRWACRQYGAVVGYSHHTLSKSPLQNAQSLWRDLRKQLGARADDRNRMDILAHGRGGLVAKALIENRRVGDGDPTSSVRHIIFAGTPHVGSHLLKPEAWGQAADVLINMAHADGSGMYARLSGLLARLGAIEQMGSRKAHAPLECEIPGLASLWPDRLRHVEQWPSDVKCSGIAAIYGPGRQHNTLGIVRECYRNSQYPPGCKYVDPTDLISESASLWNGAHLNTHKSWKVLLLHPYASSEELREQLGPELVHTLPSGMATKAAHQIGIHRTNMLALDKTQDFIRQRLLES